MLDKKIDEIVTDADGKFIGVTSAGETVKAKQVIGDPSYFGAGHQESGKLRVVEDGKVIRAICVLKSPIPGTEASDSAQIIIPQNQVNRRNGEFKPSLHEIVGDSVQTFTLPWSPQRTMFAQRMSTLLSSARSSKPTGQSKR